MTILSTIKNCFGSTWSGAKYHLAPPLFSIGKVCSSFGSALFSGFKISETFTGNANHPIKIPVAVFAASVNLIVTVVTRVRAIYKQLRSGDAVLHAPTDEDETKSTCSHFYDWDPALGKVGNSAVIVIKILGMMSGAFSSLSSYLGGITLSEFIAENIFKDEHVHDDEWKEILMQSVAMLFAISNFISYISFNVPDMEKNAKEFLTSINENKFEFTYKHVITLLASFFSIISTPFLAYFSTMNSLGKFPAKMADELKNILAITSASTATISALLNNIPALHKLFFAAPNEIPPATSIYDVTSDNPGVPRDASESLLPSWWPVVRLITYGAGVGDSVITGLSNYIGVTKSLSDWIKTSPLNPYVAYPSTLVVLSTTLMNFAFSVKRGVERTEEDLRNNRLNQVINDIEAGAGLAEPIEHDPVLSTVIHSEPRPAAKSKAHPESEDVDIGDAYRFGS